MFAVRIFVSELFSFSKKETPTEIKDIPSQHGDYPTSSCDPCGDDDDDAEEQRSLSNNDDDDDDDEYDGLPCHARPEG